MVSTSDILRMRPEYFVCPSCNERHSEEHDVDWCEADIAREASTRGDTVMDAAQLKALMDQFAMDLMQEDLEHDCWVTLLWTKGQERGGPPEIAHGPYSSASEALTKADEIRTRMANAPGANTFMAGYTPTITVVPVFGDDEKEDA